MLTGVNLPDEIMPEILARLPAKSLGRFKSVSKPWRTLISDPKFIKTHLSLYNSRRRSKVLYLSIEQRSLAVVDFNGEPLVSSMLNFNQSRRWLHLYGSCNGLALALNSRFQLTLLNPTTKECKNLPKPLNIDLKSEVFTCGLGYDSSTDDYKVVVIPESKIVNVYRLKYNCWYIVQDSPFDRSSGFYFNYPGVFSNGCLNWFGLISLSSPITAFDLADEMFRKVPPPPILGLRSDIVCGLEPNHVDGIDMWIVKEYGVYESWTKITLQLYAMGIRPLIVLNDDEFMLDIHGRTIAYNAKEKTSRDIVIHGPYAEENYKCAFVESLILLDQLR